MQLDVGRKRRCDREDHGADSRGQVFISLTEGPEEAGGELSHLTIYREPTPGTWHARSAHPGIQLRDIRRRELDEGPRAPFIGAVSAGEGGRR
jgi:hypothetical protein